MLAADRPARQLSLSPVVLHMRRLWTGYRLHAGSQERRAMLSRREARRSVRVIASVFTQQTRPRDSLTRNRNVDDNADRPPRRIEDIGATSDQNALTKRVDEPWQAFLVHLYDAQASLMPRPNSNR